MAIAQLFGPEIGRTPFRVARKMAMLRHLLAFYAPFENWRRIDIADNHAAEQWTQGVRQLVQEDYPQATRITLVMDNLNTRGGASLYKAFPPYVCCWTN